MHSCRDYTGAVILRTLMDEVRNHPDKITYLEFMPTVELILDNQGRIAGGILYNMETEEYFTVKAKATIIATGGYGRLHIRGFDTTNHYGATADGLIMAYRAGAKLLYMDSVQYHPTGAVFPEQIAGFLITEKIRGAGGQPVNKEGELFVFPRTDFTLISFVLDVNEKIELVISIKELDGKVEMTKRVSEFDCIVCDYTAIIENPLNLNVRIAKRIEITREKLSWIWGRIQYRNVEQPFEVDRIRNVG